MPAEAGIWFNHRTPRTTSRLDPAIKSRDDTIKSRDDTISSQDGESSNAIVFEERNFSVLTLKC